MFNIINTTQCQNYLNFYNRYPCQQFLLDRVQSSGHLWFFLYRRRPLEEKERRPLEEKKDDL